MTGEPQASSRKPQAASRKPQAEKRLRQLPIGSIMWGTNGYSCDAAGDVTGLNPIKRTYKTLKP
jgi:hypothetical protein